MAMSLVNTLTTLPTNNTTTTRAYHQRRIPLSQLLQFPPHLHTSTLSLPLLINHQRPTALNLIRQLPSASQENLNQQLTVETSPPLISASDVVRKFYKGINDRDLAAVEGLIAQNCVYEDLIFPQPFLGRKSIMEFFGQFIDYISKDLQFVIDDISEEDSSAVGVTWHLEWNGKLFPFSKGCSFYRLEIANGVRQIIYARDIAEPAIKPGESALIIIRGVTWLLQRFPKLVDRL